MLELIQNFDTETILKINEYGNLNGLSHIMKAISFLGDDGMVWIFMSIVMIVMKWKRVGFESLLALSFSYALTEIIKSIIERPRPFYTLHAIKLAIEVPPGTSFPSGHTATSFAVATVICRLMPRGAGFVAFAIAALMGVSRIYLGVHYPSDVFAGMVVGVVSGLIVDLISKNGIYYIKGYIEGK